MATRIYKVTHNNNVWLVRSTTRSQAIAYIASKEMSAAVATQEDLVGLISNGGTVANVKEDQLPLTLGDE